MSRLTPLFALFVLWSLVVTGMVLVPTSSAAPTPDDAAAEAGDDEPAGGDAAEVEPAKTEVPKKLSKDPPGMKRLQPDADVWIDPKNKRVVMDGVVCLRAGTLEMLACTKGTKEHESILAVDTKAMAVHAALLAVGARRPAPRSGSSPSTSRPAARRSTSR